jgi:hypothetical protein
MLFWMNGPYVHYTDYGTGIRYYAWNEPVLAAEPRLRPGGAEAPGKPDRDARGRRYPFRRRGDALRPGGAGGAVLFPDRAPAP